MSTVIIGGSGHLKGMIDKANVQSGTDAWTPAQIAFLAAKYADWANQIDSQIASPQPPA